MWKCNICETINEDSFKFCPVCGRGKDIAANTAVILRENDNESSVQKKSVSNNYFSDNHTSQNSSIYPRIVEPARYTDEDIHSATPESVPVYNWIATLAIAIIIIAVLVVSIGHVYMKKSLNDESELTETQSELTISIAVSNGIKSEDIWYIGDTPLLVSWYANRDGARYNVELIDGNDVTYIYYENTANTDIEISNNYFEEDEIYTLRIVAIEGVETYTKELKLALAYAPTAKPTAESVG